MSQTVLEIDLDKVKKNLHTIRKKLPSETSVMAIVKSDAYGLGAKETAFFLESIGIDFFGVSNLPEAKDLRECGIKGKILIFSAFPQDWEEIIAEDFQLAVNSLEEIEQLSLIASSLKKLFSIHLYVDTGMRRFGCSKEEVSFLAKQIIGRPSLHLAGIMTHFASADNAESDPFTLSQAASFDACIRDLQNDQIPLPYIHASNSAAALRFHFPKYNLVRIGLAFFGVPTSSDVPNILEPAITLKSAVIGINHCNQGDTASYLQRFTASRDTLIGIIPLGYFHGLHRSYGNRAEVLIKGKKAPLIGNITMDCSLVDITEIPDVKIGDEVTIFGPDINIGQMAEKGKTIAHELITCLHPSIPRSFKYQYEKSKLLM